MTPLQFEQMYQDGWAELEGQLNSVLRDADRRHKPRREEAARRRRAPRGAVSARVRASGARAGARVSRLSLRIGWIGSPPRRIRSSISIAGSGSSRITQFFAADFPRAVRAHAVYVWIATAVFVLPTIIIGLLVYSAA